MTKMTDNLQQESLTFSDPEFLLSYRQIKVVPDFLPCKGKSRPL